MIKFQRSTAKLGLDILGINYDTLVEEGLEEEIRKIANAGFDFFPTQVHDVDFCPSFAHAPCQVFQHQFSPTLAPGTGTGIER